MLSLIHGTDVIVISSHQYGSKEVRTSVLMDQMALGRKVYFINKPIIGMTKANKFFYTKEANKVTVVQPYLAAEVEQNVSLKDHLINLVKDERLKHLTFWTDTRKGEVFVNELDPKVTVYDGKEIFEGSDVVLTPSMPTEQVMGEIKALSSAPEIASEYVEQLNAYLLDETKLSRRSTNSIITIYQSFAGN